MVKSFDIKEAIGVQVNFVSKNKHQTENFFIKIRTLFWQIIHPFWNYASILGSKYVYVWHNLGTEKEGTCEKYSQYKTSNSKTSDFHVGN